MVALRVPTNGIAQWRREQGISLTRRKSESKARVTRDGYTAGQLAGDSISLERQVIVAAVDNCYTKL